MGKILYQHFKLSQFILVYLLDVCVCLAVLMFCINFHILFDVKKVF